MSSYGISPTDLNVRLSPQRRIELTDNETTPTGSENTAVTQAAIDAAEVKFHGYAGRYYQIPIAPRSDATADEVTMLTALVKRTIVAIAAYDLMARKPEWLDRGEQQTYWGTLNKESSTFLADLADPKRPVVLPAALERLVPTVTDGGGAVVSDESIFTRCTLRRY